jgi:hypothetical protein
MAHYAYVLASPPDSTLCIGAMNDLLRLRP